MAEKRENTRKVREGVVIKNKMAKTVTVKIDRRLRHPHLGKIVIRSKKVYAHTENPIEVGAKVKIQEVRPLSKLKRWRVIEA